MVPESSIDLRKGVVCSSKRVCFFSHFDADDVIDDYVVYYLNELQRAGFTTIFVSTSSPDAQEIDKLKGLCADVILRDNLGLDFGGWIECWRRYDCMEAELLLLCNDSVYGPFWNLRQFIDDLIAVPADFYGAVLSLEPMPHLQSWFLLLSPTAYGSRYFERIMRTDIQQPASKLHIIQEYEEKLTLGLASEGLSFRAAFDPREIGPILSENPVDPAKTLWRELLLEGFVPFLKIGILREGPLWVVGLRDWYQVAEKLNVTVAELAARNLSRRQARVKKVRLQRLREALRLPVLPLAQAPYGKSFLVKEIRSGRTRAGSSPLNRLFSASRFIYDAVRAPYVFLYSALGQARRRL